MWSRKPTLVEIFDSPPSRSSRRRICVSFVSRLISAVRLISLFLRACLDGIGVNREALGAGQRSDRRGERPGRLLRDRDRRDPPPEDSGTERPLETPGAAGGKHVVRTRGVVAEGRRATLADEDAARGGHTVRE